LRRSSILLLLFFAAFVFMLFPGDGAHAQVLDRSVARVRLTTTANIGQRALRSQIELYESQSGRELSSDERREVLDIMINEELIEQAAERDGVSISDQELEQRIEQERQSLGSRASQEQFEMLVEQELGIEYDEYRDELEKQLLQQRYIQQAEQERFADMEEPSEDEIRSVYNENVQEFINPEMVRFDHVYVDARELDDSERSSARETIEELYSEVSDDSISFEQAYERAEESDELGRADFGYLAQNDRQLRQQLGSDFIDTVFELEDGEVSGVHESQVGFHIVRITDKRERRFLDLDDPLVPGQSVTVRENIRQYIMNNRMQQEFAEATNSVLERLREEAEITVNEDNLDW
ncbi:MAG: peptidyl-prolyl cis-trans isomerase, partial [Spirochaetales bacterium]